MGPVVAPAPAAAVRLGLIVPEELLLAASAGPPPVLPVRRHDLEVVASRVHTSLLDAAAAMAAAGGHLQVLIARLEEQQADLGLQREEQAS